MRLKSAFFILILVILALGTSDVCEADTETNAQGLDGSTAPLGAPGVVLVLSGGGTKGFSHIGVIEILERENIPIAGVVGTSMGGIVGGMYAAGYNPSEMRQIIKEKNFMEIISGRAEGLPMIDSNSNRAPSVGNAPFYVFVDKNGKPVGKRGVLKPKDLYAFLSDLTSRVSVADFMQLPIPFAAIATNLENGDTVILRDGNLASALRATMSIPILFDPWEVNGQLLVDGGLKANLPVIEAKKLFPGCPVIAVNLSPEDITRQRAKLNNVFEISSQTLEILMVEQIRVNVAEADVVISPHVSDFGVLDTGGYDNIVERGRVAAEDKIDELRGLMAKHGASFVPRDRKPVSAPTVAEIHFSGVPSSMAEELYEKLEHWVGCPLDMQKVAEAVRQLSAREEFLTVDSRVRNISDNSVAVAFTIERPQKYEIGIDGYASNLQTERWLGVTFKARDLLADGDVASLEYRISKNWGTMLRYFSPLDERERQFGITFSANKEEYEPLYKDNFSLERYIAKAAFYKDYGRGTRIGLGYAVQRASYDNESTENGPYLSFSYHNLDDPLLPSKGIAASTELWYPLGESLISKTVFQTYIPLWGTQKAVFSGGLKTGDADRLPYAAMLGSGGELYSLSRHPLVGDQAWWLHLGTSSTIMKTWWGGIDVEAFGKYGQIMEDWTNSGSHWEVGLGFSLSTNIMPGKVIVVYDQDGEFTFGYSLGIPNFWNGPLP